MVNLTHYERIGVKSNKLFDTFIYVLRYEGQTDRIHLGLGYESELEKSHMLCEQVHVSYLRDRAEQVLKTGKVFKTGRLEQFFEGPTFYVPKAVPEHQHSLSDYLALALVSAIPREWKDKQTACLGTNEFDGLNVTVTYSS